MIQILQKYTIYVNTQLTIPIVLERNPQLFLRISHVESCLRSLNEKHTIFTDISRLI